MQTFIAFDWILKFTAYDYRPERGVDCTKFQYVLFLITTSSKVCVPPILGTSQ